MAIAVACECGHEFEVGEALQGRQLKCPGCGQAVSAGKSSPKGNRPVKSDLIALKCGCGKRLAAKREWAGKRIKCPTCGETVKIPGGSPDGKPAASKSTLDELLDEVGVAKSARRCPECKSEMKEDHVICVNCGYDVERGKKLRTKTYQSSARKLDMEAGAAEKRANWPMKIAAVLLLLALAVVAVVMVPKFLG